MSPFGFGKKKEEATIHACCCGSAAEGTVTPCCAGSVTSVKVLGAGCKACHTQYENAKAAVQALGLNVGGKIGVARCGEHVAVAVFFAIGLVHLNEVCIGMGHRSI